MINIVYYIHEDDRVIEESINFLSFQTINNSDYQKNYTILKNEKFKNSIKYINLKNIDVINKNIKELIEKEKNCLPMVTINDNLFCKKRILTIKELSKLLDIGFNIQEQEDF